MQLSVFRKGLRAAELADWRKHRPESYIWLLERALVAVDDRALSQTGQGLCDGVDEQGFFQSRALDQILECARASVVSGRKQG